MPDSMYTSVAKATDPNVNRYMRLYFDLCSEEYHLHEKELISKDVWQMWIDGIRQNFKQQIYKDAWRSLAANYNNQFCTFVTYEILDRNV